MLNPNQQVQHNPNLLKLLNINDSDLTSKECFYKKATSGYVLDVLINLTKEDRDVIAIMCGKYSNQGHLYITYFDKSIHCVKFHFPAFSGYGSKPYANVGEYIKNISYCQTFRADYTYSHKPIRVR